MLELAIHYGEGPIPLKDIAESQNISEKYLGHLITPLKASGLLSSTQGAYGGYFLTKPPQDITLDRVIQAVEGDIALVECVSQPDFCDRSDSCITREIWKEMTEKMMECLRNTNLQELVNRRRQKQNSQLMYNI
jgi:Rrf2 family protein